MTHRTPPVWQPQSDGFLSFRSWKDGRVQSPTWTYPVSSPVANFASTSISSLSSRGSWSSLFNTNNVRQLIGSSLEPPREGHGEPTAHEGDLGAIPVPGIRNRKFNDIDSPRARPVKSDSPQPLSPTSRADVGATRSLGPVPAMVGHGRRPTFSQVARARHATVQKTVVVVDWRHELQQEG